MKEEIKKIKAMNVELGEKSREYAEARKSFNESVNNAIANGEVNGVTLYVGKECEDFYDMAVLFYSINEDIVSEAEKLRNEHPRYGEKRFRDTLVTNVIESCGIDYEEVYDDIYEDVTTYMLYEKCGYADVRKVELETVELAKAIGKEVDELLQKTGDKISDAGTKVFNAVKGVINPYVEVAKGQYTTAKGSVKKYVKQKTNKGVKKAISALEKVEKKTGSGE